MARSFSNRRENLQAQIELWENPQTFKIGSGTTDLPLNVPLWTKYPTDLDSPAEFSLVPIRNGVRYCLKKPVSVRLGEKIPENSAQMRVLLSSRGIPGLLSKDQRRLLLSSPKDFVSFSR